MTVLLTPVKWTDHPFPAGIDMFLRVIVFFVSDEMAFASDEYGIMHSDGLKVVVLRRKAAKRCT